MPYKDINERAKSFHRYYLNHKEEKRIKNKIYGQIHKKEISDNKKLYAKENKDKIREYLDKNKEKRRLYRVIYNKKYKELHRKELNQKRVDRIKNDIQFKLATNLRSRIREAVKQQNSGKRGGSGLRDLGCSVEEFKKYIESLWEIGMTWENWGLKGWHLDHIIPLASFDLTDREKFLKACHYTNIQPLWALDNFLKKDKLIWKKSLKSV